MTREGEPKERGQRARGWLRAEDNFRTILSAVVLALFIRIVLLEAFEIEGPSMEPSLLNGDRVIVAKFMYGLFIPWTEEAALNWNTPNLGDVIIAKSPAADGVDIVKRVIGLPGDTIELRDDRVYRNGQVVPRTPLGPCPETTEAQVNVDPNCEIFEERIGDVRYRISQSRYHPPIQSGHAVRVQPNTVFVMGDHRDRSNDSRYFGLVPAGRIRGRALAVYWSSYDTSHEGAGGCSPRWSRLGHAVP